MKLTMSKEPTLWLLLGWLETGTCLLYRGPHDLEVNIKLYSNHPNLDIRFVLSLLVIFVQLCSQGITRWASVVT
jgi:uncharacterized membrane protein